MTSTLDTKDFLKRWRIARIYAIQCQLTQSPLDIANPEMPWQEQESEGLLRFHQSLIGKSPEAAAKAKDGLLRAVFDNSRKLAMSLSKFKGLTFEIEDFQNLLEESDLPCAKGTWTTYPKARVLTRAGCKFCEATGSLACDMMREAFDGLVIGLGEKERLARHASIRHGDSACIDVFYSEANETMAWGPLPEHMALDLMEIAAQFTRNTGVTIDIKGFREGALFYELESSTDNHCGTTGLLVSRFQNALLEKFPGLLLKNVTPQAVLGEHEARL